MMQVDIQEHLKNVWGIKDSEVVEKVSSLNIGQFVVDLAGNYANIEMEDNDPRFPALVLRNARLLESWSAFDYHDYLVSVLEKHKQDGVSSNLLLPWSFSMDWHHVDVKNVNANVPSVPGWYHGYMQKESWGLDAFIGSSISYERNVNAVCAFWYKSPEDPTLMITQLQPHLKTGVITRKPALRYLKWENVFVESVERIAKDAEIERVGIISAANNRWTNPRNPQKYRFPMKYAIAHYDKVAKEMGFSLGEDGNYYKPL